LPVAALRSRSICAGVSFMIWSPRAPAFQQFAI
jgi:hypothetical protein